MQGCWVRRIACVLLAAGGICMAAMARGERILTVSDLHWTGSGAALAPALQAVGQMLQGQDVLLLLGDDTNNGREEEHRQLVHWLKEVSRGTSVKVYTVPGNHDWSAAASRRAYQALYGPFGWNDAFSRDEASLSCAVMTPGGTCLLLLDTNAFDRPDHALPNGGIGEATCRWAEEVLAALPAGTPVIACGHHPLLPRDRLQKTPGDQALAALLRRWGVPLYLCGHDHKFATVKEDALRQITVGQPQNYPGWCGVLEKTEKGFSWNTRMLFDPAEPAYRAQEESIRALAWNMGKGTLRGTPYQEDQAAIGWFARAFVLAAGSALTPEDCAAFLADVNCDKWRDIQTSTVVKAWILNLLAHCPEDVRQLTVP